MIYPTADALGKGNFDRYSVTIAVAKAARLVTDEYTKERDEAERKIGNKETDKCIYNLISEDLRDNKAIKTAIDRIAEGVYEIKVPSMEEEAEVEAEEKAEENAEEKVEASAE